MATIQQLSAREILDSRGHPTLEVEICATGKLIVRASVPSGASKGKYEALELRDGSHRYQGLGVQRAIALIQEEIAPVLVGKDLDSHLEWDQLLIALDGTLDKSRLGANTLLAVSLAMARGAAEAQDLPLYHYMGKKERYILPVPMMNIINGGLHVDNTLNIQEFMIVPFGAPTFKEALRYGAEVAYALKTRLKQIGCNTAVGDEGGFGPNLPSHCAAMELILLSIQDVGLKASKDISIALDVASTTFYHQGKYQLDLERQTFTSEQFVECLAQWVQEYSIISIEDGMAETDNNGWQLLTARLGKTVQVVGDDLFVTNVNRLQDGIAKKLANAVLIKPNQVGTLKETLDAIDLAKSVGFGTIISHRSGETEDTFIADLAVATDAKQIKAGALCRSERVAKYNQLLRIEESLGERGCYAGRTLYQVEDNV